MKKADINTPLPLFYEGPDLDKGPYPAIFYFAVSAKESLTVDPFNQPVVYLSKFPVRIFSVDLPYHGETFSSTDAMQIWANQLTEDSSFLENFLQKLEESIRLLVSLDLVDTTKFGVLGLSRGGFIAAHIAARIQEISTILLYAPLTTFAVLKEFSSLPPFPGLQKLDFYRIKETLATKTIKTYIGNRDTRVSTDCCLSWMRSLTDTAYEQKIRSPKIELVMKPSIGYLGHGTSPDTFIEGASWIAAQLSL